jgi:hypothetical protein
MFSTPRRRFWLSALFAGIVMGCATYPPLADVEHQSWSGHVSGMITGPMTLALQIGHTEDRQQPVAGKLEITIENTSGGFGSGKLKSTLTGTIDDGNLDAELKGQAFVSDGSAPIVGTLTGRLSGDSGRGKWLVRTPTVAGNLSGNWTLQRTRTQP